MLPPVLRRPQVLSAFFQQKKPNEFLPPRRLNKKTQFSATSQTDPYKQRIAELEQTLQEKEALIQKLISEREASSGLDKTTITCPPVLSLATYTVFAEPKAPTERSNEELTPSSNVTSKGWAADLVVNSHRY